MVVAYSARWHGVGFCYIKIWRITIVALNWGNIIMNFEGGTLNLLRPRGTDKRSLGFYGGGGVANLDEVSKRKTHVDTSL